MAEAGTKAGAKERQMADAVTRRVAHTRGGLRGPGQRAVLLLLASLPLLLFLLLPLLSLVVRVSLASVLANLMDRTVAQAIQLSIVTTLCTVGLTILGGTPLAYLLARQPFRGRTLVDSLVTLPIVMPPAVAGIALLLAFGRRGVVGQALTGYGVAIAFTPIAVVLAQTFVAAPFYVLAAKSAFRGVDRDLEQAASVDGAGPLRVFQHITFPIALPALFGGLLMTWARALGEFGATIIFAGNFPGRTQTMPLAIYLGFELDLQSALTLSLVLLTLSLVVLLVVRGVLRLHVDAVP
ncbi:MAG TPA: ABC transporter permease [Ktedonobacterales bacterium]|nr:ABC transporter permease [Ktedonobacterales bacterium]